MTIDKQPTNITPGQYGHADLHNAANSAINALIDAANGGVSSVAGRTGDVTLAQADVDGLPAALTSLSSAVSAETIRAQGAEALRAPLDSPGFTGTPTAPTPPAGNSSTRLATTAFVASAVVNPYFLRGTGSPVGVITPTGPGVQYTDTAATNGASVWLSNGTTSTSWGVVKADTGWRDISGLVDTTVVTACALLKIKRSGSTVRLAAKGCTFANTNGFYNFPAGFRAPVNSAEYGWGVSATFYVGASTGLWVSGPASIPSTVIQNMTWETVDNWPTTLPGVAA